MRTEFSMNIPMPVSGCTGTHSCVHVWRLEEPSYHRAPAIFSRQGLSLNPEFSDWPVWLAGEPQKSACLCLLPALGFQVGATIVGLYEA